MQDPYTPSEARLNMTGQALRVIAEFGFPVHIVTKSDLILKTRRRWPINRTRAWCVHRHHGRRRAGGQDRTGRPAALATVAALAALAAHGIRTGVLLDAGAAFPGGQPRHHRPIVTHAHECGAHQRDPRPSA